MEVYGTERARARGGTIFRSFRPSGVSDRSVGSFTVCNIGGTLYLRASGVRTCAACGKCRPVSRFFSLLSLFFISFVKLTFDVLVVCVCSAFSELRIMTLVRKDRMKVTQKRV